MRGIGPPEMFGIWGNGLTLLATALPLPWLWQAPPPGDLDLHAFARAIAGSGFPLLVTAHAKAPVAVLAPFQYNQLLYGILLGLVLFGDRPEVRVLVGASVVAASGFYIFRREAIRPSANGAAR